MILDNQLLATMSSLVLSHIVWPCKWLNGSSFNCSDRSTSDSYAKFILSVVLFKSTFLSSWRFLGAASSNFTRAIYLDFCSFKQSLQSNVIERLHSAVGYFIGIKSCYFVSGFIHHSFKPAIVAFKKTNFVLVTSMPSLVVCLFFTSAMILLQWCKKWSHGELHLLQTGVKPVCMCKSGRDITYLWGNIALPHMGFKIHSAIITVLLTCAVVQTTPFKNILISVR